MLYKPDNGPNHQFIVPDFGSSVRDFTYGPWMDTLPSCKCNLSSWQCFAKLKSSKTFIV